GDAYLRLLGPLPVHRIIGEAAGNFPASQTLSQVVAGYRGMSTSQRAMFREVARSDVRAAKMRHTDLPHTIEQLERGETTAYNIFLQAMFQSVDEARSYDPKTRQLHGHEVDRSNAVLAQLEHDQATRRAELLRHAESLQLPQIPRTPGAARTQAVTELFNLIPNYFAESY